MADQNIDSSLIELDYNRFGAPSSVYSKPEDGWTGSSHFNVAAPAYPPGTTIQAYHKNTDALGVAGYYQMTYLRFGTKLAAKAPACKSLCVSQDATNTGKVTNDVAAANAIVDNRGVYALGAMTDNYYGFFLSGGVFPTDDVSGLDGNLLTTNAVVAKTRLIAGVGATTANEAVLAPLLESTVNGGFGIAFAADA